ncbi:MAG TPA: hypothetical protein VFY65_08430, partial [Longimicrobium sp.]|nr:hypothetical protein [Longimicrobium sp.]
IKLDVEALEVESFDTAEKPSGRGTVHGAQSTEVWCTGGECTGLCSQVSQPVVICNTNNQEVCPEQSGIGCV